MAKQIHPRVLICVAALIAGLNAEVVTNGIIAKLGGFQLSNATSAELGMLSNIFMDPQNGLITRAERALEERLKETVQNYNVSDMCLNHTEAFLQGLVSRRMWAIRSKFSHLCTRKTCP